MTNANNPDDDIRAIVADLARMQTATQFELDMLIDNTNRVLGHDAIVSDVILEIRENTEVLQRNFEQHQQNFERHQQNFERHQESTERLQRNFEQHQRNFEENQKTTNAALNSLEAILLQLTRRDN